MAVPALPSLALFVILLACPESPRHLFITERREQAAADSIRFYQGAKEAHVSAIVSFRHWSIRISDGYGGPAP